jgi:molecular chaperone DnaJ
MSDNFYEVLGVNQEASTDDIKKAYKKLAKKYHPDLNQGNKEYEEKFKTINEAYRVLSDSKLKQNYDRFGSAEGSQAGFDQSGFGQGDMFNDIFESFFGGGGSSFFRGGRRSRKRTPTFEVEIGITFEEAAKGTSRTINIPTIVKCDKCNGTGAESDDDIETCPDCQGHGFVNTTRNMGPFGNISQRVECRRCHGKGKIIKKKCKKCHGEGSLKTEVPVEVEIPSGIDNGDRLRLRNVVSTDDYNADLIAHIRVHPHKIFKRERNNIIIEIDVPFNIAALGGKIEVPTLDGDADLKIPTGLEPNSILKMRGKGIKDARTGYLGDLLVITSISVPKKLSRKQKKILEDFSKL